MDKPAEINKLELAEAGLSEKFCRQSAQMGYHTLDDIFQEELEVLFKKTDFSYLWLEELTKFLTERKMLHLLQPLPGNNQR